MSFPLVMFGLPISSVLRSNRRWRAGHDVQSDHIKKFQQLLRLMVVYCDFYTFIKIIRFFSVILLLTGRLRTLMLISMVHNARKGLRNYCHLVLNTLVLFYIYIPFDWTWSVFRISTMASLCFRIDKKGSIAFL